MIYRNGKSHLGVVKTKTRKILSGRSRRQLPAVFALALLVIVALFTALLPPEQSYAAPFPTCESRGILFQYTAADPGSPTTEQLIDMASGQHTSPGSIAGRQINAIGYNVQDNFIYGWDNLAGEMVRVHEDLSVDGLGVPAGYAGPTSGIIIGDVDENGDYWFIGGGDWHQVDLTPASGTYMDVLNSGPAAGPTGTAGADWAFVPDGDGLYRVMNDAGTAHLWVFDRTTHGWSDLGALSSIPSADLTEGAFYADADGYLYASANGTGDIWRVDVQNVTAAKLSTGPASSGNDGARCANAPIPLDFGDAPSSYDTLLGDGTDGGPRHSIAGYNSGAHAAPLMLGTSVDIDEDGFPGTVADGDNLDDIDDEEGVAHIVATPGTPTTLSIPVTVTNTDSTAATLAGWVDLDDDGTFETGERVMRTIPANSGTALYEMDFPSATFTTDSYARFRVFQGAVADPQPTGSATGGEVEDYEVQVGTYQASKVSDPADGTSVATGSTVTYTLTVTNTGTTDLANLSFYDDLSNVLDDAELAGTPVVAPASAGTATVDQTAQRLVFDGDVPTGQNVTVTYKVKVNGPAALGNSVLGNMVIATHSNCDPDIDGQTVTVADPQCQTEHRVAAGSLADTGDNATLVLVLAVGLIGTSGIVLYRNRALLAVSHRAARK